MSVEVAANDSSARSGLSNEERNRAARRAWRILRIVVILLLAVPMFGASVVALRLHHTRQAPPPINPQPDSAFASIHKKLQDVALQLEVAQTKQSIHHAETVERQWTTLLEDTLRDDLGKRIAGNESELLRFMALRQMQAPEPRIGDVTDDLIEIERNGELSKEARRLQQLSSEAANLKQHALAVLTFHQGRLKTLNDLRRNTAKLPLSDSELQTVLHDRTADLDTKRQAIVAAAANELSDAMQSDLDQLETQRDTAGTLVNDLKKQLTHVELGEQAAPSAPNDPPETPASREDYRSEFDDIRAKLKPFITPGYAQPESADKLVYEKSQTSRFILSSATSGRVGGNRQGTGNSDSRRWFKVCVSAE